MKSALSTVNPPTTLGRYTLLEPLYCGSRTAVYRACGQDSAQTLILKFLQSECPTSSELLQFRNQYTIAHNLDLPGTLAPYALEFVDNRPLLVMEDDGSISLAQYLGDQPGRSLDVAAFLALACQLAESLVGLHRHGIVHKDIKPANILIQPASAQVKLIDFSLASLLPRETAVLQHPKSLEGTLAYLAPEQTGRMNRAIDYRSDFYALGVTFYEVLAGRLPFRGDDALGLIHSHIAKQPPDLCEIAPQVPPTIAAIVAKLMAKNAEDRYQSAGGLLRDLLRCQAAWDQAGAIAPFALGQNDACDRFLIPEKLYGRQAEVAALLAAFERVAQGTTEVVLVAGFSGIGKTAVIHELHKPIVRQRGYFIAGKFDQFDRNIPFSAFVQAFRSLIAQLLSEGELERSLWQEKLRSALGDNGQVLMELIPELEAILGPQPPVAELSGMAAQNRFNLLFRQLVQVFAQPDHPLALFLDDLQWADLASLNLLQLLSTEAQVGSLLILGAYRNNEVSSIHPFSLAVEAMIQGGATVATLTLDPLDLADVTHLVADSLNCDRAQAAPLGELIYAQTQGNPFFTNQCLKKLYETDCLSFDNRRKLWHFDLGRIRKQDITADVVEFMAGQLQTLPLASQRVLQWAACIGNQFDLKTLAIVAEQSPTEVAANLWPALQEGFILPQSHLYKLYVGPGNDRSVDPDPPEQTVHYRFLHDRVQQAAYSLIPARETQATHLKIGQLLLANTPPAELEERLFAIVNQLNQGASLLQTSPEKLRLSQLDLLAARKAKAATAYAAARTYAETGMNLLADTAWDTTYDLAFALHQIRVETEYLSGDFAAAQTWSDYTLARAKHPLEKAEIYSLSVVQYTLRASYPEAIETGRRALELLGIELPRENFEAARDAELAQTQTLLGDRPLTALLDLPTMDQPEQKMAIKLLISMGPPTYRSHQRLWSVICAKAVNLCLRYGNTPEVGYIYPAFGGLRGFALQTYAGTGDLLAVTVELLRRFHNPSAESVGYLMIGSSLRHWSHPLSAATEDYLTSYRVGLASSNLQYAAYAFGHNTYCRFYQSIPLESLVEEMSESWQFSQKHKNQWAIDLIFGCRNVVLELLETSTLDSLEETRELPSRTDEADYLGECEAHKNSQVICIYNILKAQVLLVLDRPHEGLVYAQRAEAAIVNVAPQGLLPYARHCFVYSLLLAAVYDSLSAPEQALALAQLHTNLGRLETWAAPCPVAHQAQAELVRAEVARLEGDRARALEGYDAAIAAAQTSHFVAEEALANELAARFYRDWGKERLAQEYLRAAYYAYSRWGAIAKIEQLETKQSEQLKLLLDPINTSLSVRVSTKTSRNFTLDSTKISTTKTGLGSLDLAALLKASQTLSTNIELQDLVAALLHLAIELAGASKGVLILCSEAEWIVQAVENDQDNSDLLITNVPLADSQEVPQSLMYAVAASHQPRVIQEASADLDLSHDPYVLHHQPKSILALPVLYQGTLSALLYLENRWTVGAFTSDRLELLNLISTQAAISLTNAKLYQQSQQTLAELQAAELHVVQSEKMSALGNLVAGVAHEINNPLGFLVGNIKPALTEVQELLELIDLYQATYPHPPSDLDDKINEIDLDYLREDLPKLIGSMAEGVDRIKGISDSLRVFARADTLVPQSFDLHAGLASTLLILKHRLKANEQRPAIEITEDYGSLPLIECFPGQLNQVFMNILANAIDALDEAARGQPFNQLQENPPQIRIQTQHDSSWVKVLIRDNGPGMSETVQARMFDRSFTTKAVGQGTGLGLAIVHSIMETHRGRITVNSSPGQGTEFILTLPIDGPQALG